MSEKTRQERARHWQFGTGVSTPLVDEYSIMTGVAVLARLDHHYSIQQSLRHSFVPKGTTTIIIFFFLYLLIRKYFLGLHTQT